MQMIRQMFKIMVNGVSQERLLVLMDEAIKKGLNQHDKDLSPQNQENEIFDSYEGQIYMSLAKDKYDPGEYRLPLWLPLTLEQKLDMLLHQRNHEEVEMMQFLIDEEQGCGHNCHAPSLKKYEEVDKKLEQALDGLLFEKYMALTRMQALNSSIHRCEDRLKNRKGDDGDLMKYAEWLKEKLKNAREYENTVKQEIKA